MGELTREFFEKIYNDSEIGVGFVDLTGTITDVNETFLKITKYTRKDLVHVKRYPDITPDELFDYEAGVVNELLGSERSVRYEKEFICGDGTIIPALLNSVCLRDDEGNPYALAGTVQEITRYRSYKDGLKESENKFLALLDISPDVICELGTGGTFIYVSPNSGDVLTYLPSELRGREFLTFIHIDDIAKVKSKMERALKTVSTEYASLRFNSKKDGWQWIDCVIKPFRNSMGEARLILALKNDSSVLKPRPETLKTEPGMTELASDLDRRVRDLNILYTVTKAVHRSLELRELYNLALDTLIDLDNVDMAFIYVVDEVNREAVLEAHRNVPESYIQKAARIPEGRGITWKIIGSGRLVNIEDVQVNKDIGPAGKELGHHGILGIPLTTGGGKVMGVLFFATYRTHVFDENEVSLFSSIAEHLSVALTKAKLYDELHKKNKREKIISAVTRSVHRSLDLKNVLQNAADSIKRNIDQAECVAIYTANGSEVVLNAQSNNNQDVKLYEVFVPEMSGVTWSLLNTGKPVIDNHIDPEKGIGVDFTEPGSSVRSYIGMPLRYKKRIIGAISISSSRENAFDARELGFFRIVTKQIESAIDNAWMAEALRLSEKKYRDLYENVPAGIYCKSRDGRIIMANRMLIQMLNYKSFEDMVCGDRMRNAFVTGTDREMFSRILRRRSKITDFESTWIRSDGSVLDVIESVRPITNATGRVIYYEGTVTDITERKAVEKKLKSSRERLRKLTSYLQQFREEERTLIAREIHDEFAQLLTGRTIDLSWLKKKLPRYIDPDSDTDVYEKLDSFSVLLGGAFEAVKKICAKLRPRILDDLGIVAAIRWQIDAVKAQTDMDFRFRSSEGFTISDPKVSTAVFRIFQESLTNVIRHAEATRVTVNIGKKDNRILFGIRDNGKGITESSMFSTKSMGLLGIRERVHELGGEVKIKGVSGKGTSIRVQIPVKQRSTC